MFLDSLAAVLVATGFGALFATAFSFALAGWGLPAAFFDVAIVTSLFV